MKKTLVTLLALVFVLSVATVAFAAPNPFVDVPAKHWAYNAVSQLAAAGIIDGYGDGTFRGDRTMTRYEMAQIVAKAMARSDKADAEQRAIIDKLSVEFAAELNNLGVRVAKLEAGASSIKFSGDFRFRWVHSVGDVDYLQSRLRLNMSSEINDNTSFTGSLIAQNYSQSGRSTDKIGYTDASLIPVWVKEGKYKHRYGCWRPNGFGYIPSLDVYYDHGNDINSALNIETAYFTTKDLLGTGSTVSVGRNYLYLGQGYLADTPGFDGIQATFGNQLKVTVGYGDIAYAPSLSEGAPAPADQKMVSTANISYAVNPNLTLTGSLLHGNSEAYLPGTMGENPYPGAPNFYSLGFNYKMSPDWTLQGEYAKNSNADDNNKGFFAQLNYKGADMKVPGSYGLWVGYVRAEDYAIDDAISTLYYYCAGTKSVYGGVSYTPAKNVTLMGEVQNVKVIDDNSSLDTRYRLYLIYHF